MNIIKRAVLLSTALHLLYVAGTFLLGFIQTATYEPDIIAEANHTDLLQDEVVIGTTGSPVLYVFTWIGLAVVIALFDLLLQRSRRTIR